MQRLSKLLCVGLITALLGMLFSISVFAEEAPEPPALSLEDVTFVFEYTSDSPVSEGLVTKIYTDPISNESGIELVPEFGIGYTLSANGSVFPFCLRTFIFASLTISISSSDKS